MDFEDLKITFESMSRSTGEISMKDVVLSIIDMWVPDAQPLKI